MPKPDIALDGRSNATVGDLLRSGREALSVYVFKQLPKNESEIRALIAQRPVLTAALATAAGSVAMQLVLSVLRRKPREAVKAPSTNHLVALATAIWPFVRKPTAPTQREQSFGSDPDESGVHWSGAPSARLRRAPPESRWPSVFVKRGQRAVNKAALQASALARTKARSAAHLAEGVSDIVLQRVETTAKNRPVSTLIAAAGVGFVVTWICARR